jgi:hypothetical protein
VEVKLSYDISLTATCQTLNVPKLVDKMTDSIFDRLDFAGAIITTTHYCEDLVAATSSSPRASAARVSVSSSSSSASTRNLLQAANLGSVKVGVENTIIFPQNAGNADVQSLSPASATQVIEAVADQITLVVDKAVGEVAKEDNMPGLTATVTEAVVTLQCQVRRGPWRARTGSCLEGRVTVPGRLLGACCQLSRADADSNAPGCRLTSKGSTASRAPWGSTRRAATPPQPPASLARPATSSATPPPSATVRSHSTIAPCLPASCLPACLPACLLYLSV